MCFLDIGQRTAPPELPIYGDPVDEISLELIFPKGNPVFLLNGKTLQLLQPLDRDKENLSHIIFQVPNFVHLCKPIVFILCLFTDIMHGEIDSSQQKYSNNCSCFRRKIFNLIIFYCGMKSLYSYFS